jgi:hypothetical protein
MLFAAPQAWDAEWCAFSGLTAGLRGDSEHNPRAKGDLAVLHAAFMTCMDAGDLDVDHVKAGVVAACRASLAKLRELGDALLGPAAGNFGVSGKAPSAAAGAAVHSTSRPIEAEMAALKGVMARHPGLGFLAASHVAVCGLNHTVDWLSAHADRLHMACVAYDGMVEVEQRQKDRAKAVRAEKKRRRKAAEAAAAAAAREAAVAALALLRRPLPLGGAALTEELRKEETAAGKDKRIKELGRSLDARRAAVEAPLPPCFESFTRPKARGGKGRDSIPLTDLQTTYVEALWEWVEVLELEKARVRRAPPLPEQLTPEEKQKNDEVLRAVAEQRAAADDTTAAPSVRAEVLIDVAKSVAVSAYDAFFNVAPGAPPTKAALALGEAVRAHSSRDADAVNLASAERARSDAEILQARMAVRKAVDKRKVARGAKGTRKAKATSKKKTKAKKGKAKKGGKRRRASDSEESDGGTTEAEIELDIEAGEAFVVKKVTHQRVGRDGRKEYRTLWTHIDTATWEGEECFAWNPLSPFTKEILDALPEEEAAVPSRKKKKKKKKKKT